MFTPNYENIVSAARNQKSDRIPIYEHLISTTIMEQVAGKRFAHLIDGGYEDKLEFFRCHNGFQRDMGYDAVAFECCVGPAMPGSGALGEHKEGVIKTREDFEAYPWDQIPDAYFDKYGDDFRALRETMPEGMKAIGGVGNGVFECVQDVVGFQALCYISADDHDLYQDLFTKVGDLLCVIWERFMSEFGDVYCVCRFGDDLGFKSTTLLSRDDIVGLIIPQYKRIISIVHRHEKPFLLHSCGCVFNVMEEMIAQAGIDAKHSNEDVIAPFGKWIDDYGSRIGNFGGLDTDVLTDFNTCDIVRYATDVFEACAAKGHGIAIGSGNSIPDYVSLRRYRQAIETIRRLRGESVM